MTWALKRFSLTKKVPLAISRGTTSAVVRLELSVERDGFCGRGEMGGLRPVTAFTAPKRLTRSSGMFFHGSTGLIRCCPSGWIRCV